MFRAPFFSTLNPPSLQNIDLHINMTDYILQQQRRQRRQWTTKEKQGNKEKPLPFSQNIFCSGSITNSSKFVGFI